MVAIHALGRPRRTPRGWSSLAPIRHGTSNPCGGEIPSTRAFRLAYDQACARVPRAPVPEQRDRELRRGGCSGSGAAMADAGTGAASDVAVAAGAS